MMSKFDPDRHHRHSIRLDAHEYAAGGVYFVTLCVHGRLSMFGDISQGEMHINDIGQMMADEWNKLLEQFPDVWLDAYVIMPNHLHGIVAIHHPAHENQAKQLTSLGKIIGAFKSRTTHRYIQEMELHDWPGFEGKIWQRNYFERIIRNDRELDLTRQYIAANPANWQMDQENPALSSH